MVTDNNSSHHCSTNCSMLNTGIGIS